MIRMFTFVFLLYLFAAFALSAAMDPDALLQEAEQALERDPTDYKAWCKRALAAYTRAQYADAEKDFKKALSSAPPEKQPDILYNLGNCCFMQKSLQAAAASYRSGLKLRPNDADMLYNYAVTRKLMNEEKKQGDRDDSSKESQSGEGENKQGEKEQNQNEEPKQNEQPEKQPGQQAGEMSREEALRLLRALQEQERETSPNQDKKIIGGLRHEKDW